MVQGQGSVIRYRYLRASDDRVSFDIPVTLNIEHRTLNDEEVS